MTELAKPAKKFPITLVIILTVAVTAMVTWLVLTPKTSTTPKANKIAATKPKIVEPAKTSAVPMPEDKVEQKIIVEEPIPEPKIEKPIVKKPVLPALDDSDLWLQTKLTKMTWRKELLKLVIDDDMIRRFVVFTDNFAQGQLAYEHSPFVQPQISFSASESKIITKDKNKVWLWDEKTTRRFSLYIDLLRSFDSESLIAWYQELKPLIDQAYGELGYEDNDFTDTLQQAINRVLDMEIPKQPLDLVRPSVMYKFKDPQIEALDDSDKLLLRLGKENLLVIKSVLLEISDQLARQSQAN